MAGQANTAIQAVVSSSCDVKNDDSNPKREAILAAAGHLFFERGYAGTSMEAIAEAAPVSKPTLYNHFRDKNDLFAAVVLERCEQFWGEIEGALSHADDAEPALRIMTYKFVDMVHEERALAVHRIVISEWRQFPELCTRFYECGPCKGTAMLADFLRRQNEMQKMNVPNPDSAAALFFNMLKGDMHTKCMLGLHGPLSHDEKNAIVDMVVPLFVRGYART